MFQWYTPLSAINELQASGVPIRQSQKLVNVAGASLWWTQKTISEMSKTWGTVQNNFPVNFVQ